MVLFLQRGWLSNCLRKAHPRSVFIDNLPTQFRSFTVGTKPGVQPSSAKRYLLVQLTKDIPNVGSRGDVVKVRRGYMRKWLYPYSKAKYLRPGSLTLKTDREIEVPPLPEYRRIFWENAIEPTDVPFEELLLKKRLRRSSKGNISQDSNRGDAERKAQGKTKPKEKSMVMMKKETKWETSLNIVRQDKRRTHKIGKPTKAERRKQYRQARKEERKARRKAKANENSIVISKKDTKTRSSKMVVQEKDREHKVAQTL